jgi:dephospho-CoA kinase
MLKVALTGGIATGKSFVRERFDALGVPTIDADSLARDALLPSSPIVPMVVERFGRSILGPDGTIDRKALGAIVFSDDVARRDLESLIHPVVLAAIAAWLVRLTAKGAPPLAIADIPLLYETKNESRFDRVVVTRCDAETQLERLMKRDHLSQADARKRIDAQWPLEEKVRRADYVIDTGGSTDQTNLHVVEVLRQLRAIGPFG